VLAGYSWYCDEVATNPGDEYLPDFTFPLRFTIPVANLAKSNGDDIRITTADGADTSIPYGLKTITTDGTYYYLFVYAIANGPASGTVTFRCYHGNASATNGEDRDGVWDADTALAMPLGGSGGTLDYSDWSGHQTPSNGGATLGSSSFGGAASFAGYSFWNGNCILCGEVSPTSAITFSIAVSIASVNYSYQSGYCFPFRHGDSTSQGYAPPYYLEFHASNMVGGVTNASGTQTEIDGSSISLDTDYLFTVVYDGANVTFYQNDSDVGSSALSGTILQNNQQLSINACTEDGNDYYNYLNGTAHDATVDFVARSPAWIAARSAFLLSGDYLTQGDETPSPPAVFFPWMRSRHSQLIGGGVA
jgi:hypothetical protein